MSQPKTHQQSTSHQQNDKDWVVIKSFTNPIEVSLCEYQLFQAGIPFLTLNQLDSSYLSFGQIHVHVQFNDLEVARKVLTSQHE